MAKNMARLEDNLKHEQEEKSTMAVDMSSVRELCAKLESSKEQLSRQLTTKSLDFEKVGI